MEISIQGSLFADFRDALMGNGVSSLTLFPDLDGLSAHLERKFFYDPNPAL